MELSKESNTPQFIKTVDYQEDFVKNSLEMGKNEMRGGQGREYRSPGRGGYQARYPASLGTEGGNEIGSNPNQSRYSPPKYRVSPNNKYSKGVQNNNMRNRNQTLDVSNSEIPYNFSSKPYSSPNHYNSSPSFLPSPYVTPQYPQANYTSQNNLLSQQLSSQSNSRSLIELQKLTSELKLSLQQSLSTQSSLQEHLNKEKSRSFQLSEIKRKLQEELSKMEFQLDRITNSDVLGQREVMIKYEAQMLENQRLNSQLNDTIEELKRVKNQCRDCMSQNTKLREECQLLRRSNGELLDQMDELGREVGEIKRECNESMMRERQLIVQNNQLKQGQFNNNNSYVNRGQQCLQQQNQVNPSGNLKSIHTTRTSNYQSVQLSRYGSTPNQMSNSQLSPQNDLRFNNRINKSPQHNLIIKPSSPTNIYPPQISQEQYINYELQNSKLVEDYSRLQMENHAMKKLYKEFYQQSPQNQQRSISEHSEEFQSTNPNFYHHQLQQDSRLQTFQKNQLYQQISILRQEVISELMQKYFTHALSQAQTKKANVLVVFIKLLTKDIDTIEKMIVNYLEARDLLKKELNVKRLTEGQEGKPTTQYEIEAESMWSTVKDKLKVELKSHQNPNAMDHTEILTLNINAYFLALFRLLTLVQKYQHKLIEISSNTLSKIKHSALKYVHKIHEETSLLKHNSKKNLNNVPSNQTDKVSMRK